MKEFTNKHGLKNFAISLNDLNIIQEAIKDGDKISLSWLQRKFLIGFNEAEKLMDKLKMLGIVKDE
jgi:DNA segregation ATPase FtsK/SpoIIIE-like protein